MSEQTPVDSGYRPGDVVNGHVLTGLASVSQDDVLSIEAVSSASSSTRR